MSPSAATRGGSAVCAEALVQAIHAAVGKRTLIDVRYSINEDTCREGGRLLAARRAGRQRRRARLQGTSTFPAPRTETPKTYAIQGLGRVVRAGPIVSDYGNLPVNAPLMPPIRSTGRATHLINRVSPRLYEALMARALRRELER